MADDPRNDRDLVTAYRAGSESAARQLFDRYCEKLMRLARRRIGQRMASRLDPEDAVQSAFRTFFARVKNDEFTFQNEDDLFKLLVRLTVNKTLRQIAHHRAAKRDPGKEAGQGGEDENALDQLVASDPLPEVQVALVEGFEQFFKQFKGFDQDVLKLRFEGYTTAEIAERMGTYERKVRRVFERAEALARGQTDAGDAEE